MEFKIAVCLITYNQEKYIAKAIESVLMQKADFKYQLYIGDDCSSDNTLAICLEYQGKYPDIVKVLNNEKNVGVVPNTMKTLSSIRKSGAIYIAMLEGDDYWLDPYKLQKQANFLDANPDFGVVRTGSYNYIQKKNKMVIAGELSDITGNVFEMAKNYNIIRTCAVCFREKLLDKIDFNGFISHHLSIADFPMFAIFSKFTKFGYLPDLCVVYRVLEGSVSHDKNCDKLIKYDEGYINAKKYLHELFPDDIAYDEAWAQDYVNYTRLKCAYINWDYRKAKSIVAGIQTKNYKKKKLVRYVNNIIAFYLANSIKFITDKVRRISYNYKAL